MFSRIILLDRDKHRGVRSRKRVQRYSKNLILQIISRKFSLLNQIFSQTNFLCDQFYQISRKCQTFMRYLSTIKIIERCMENIILFVSIIVFPTKTYQSGGFALHNARFGVSLHYRNPGNRHRLILY